MKLTNLITNEINQNGYHFNKLTKNKIGILYIAPVNIVPDDCLACDGYVLKIIDYKKLHSVIGTSFNTGAESEDEFRIPDYNITGRFLQPGTSIGSQIAAGLPNISGSFGSWSRNYSPTSGAFYNSYSTGVGSGGASSAGSLILYHFSASNSNSIYGNSSTVQPPSQIVHLCIKYK